MTFKNPHEQFCFDTATHFTAVRGRIMAGNRTRETFDTIGVARTYAATFGDNRTMIYAVNSLGNSAHIMNA